VAINKKTHVIFSVVCSREVEKELTEKAKTNNRSRSSQVIIYIQQGLEKNV